MLLLYMREKYSAIPYQWDRRMYLSYCDGIMLTETSPIKDMLYDEYGFVFYSWRQLPGEIVRTNYIAYLKPMQLLDVILISNAEK